jgi:hypothetical protein
MLALNLQMAVRPFTTRESTQNPFGMHHQQSGAAEIQLCIGERIQWRELNC